MSESASRGSVVYNAELDCKYVLRRGRALTVHEELFSLLPHEEGDYSYQCGDAECPCAEAVSRVAKMGESPEAAQSAQRSHRDAAFHVMALRVRNRTGCWLTDCQIAVKRTRDVDSAVAWLTDKRRLVPLYR